MLHVCGGGPPVVFHDTFDSAAAEAERLSLKENKSVAVLQGVAICVPPQITPVSWEFADNVVVNEDEEVEDEAAKIFKEDERFQEILSWLFPRK
jgi:fibronectin type 3 domain-containing protein